MFLMCFLFIVGSISCEQDLFLSLISEDTNKELNLHREFVYGFKLACEGEAPILFYSLRAAKQLLKDDEKHFIPLKQFDNPHTFCDALSALGKGLIDRYPDYNSCKLYNKIYTMAVELTESTLQLLESLEKHPNARLTKKLNSLFQSWNDDIKNNELLLVKSFAIEAKNLKKDSFDLVQLKKTWFLAYNYVIFGTIIDSSKDRKTTMQKVIKFDDDFKNSIAQLKQLQTESEKITFFDRVYGKRYVILGLIITIPLALHALYNYCMSPHYTR